MNYLNKQYKKDSKFKIKHNYLSNQFSNVNDYLKLIKKVVKKNDFTLGNYVKKFEDKFKSKISSKYAIGVGSGTDAIKLSLHALNIKKGDEVILPSFTFYATLNPIIAVGAKPVFVDSKMDFNIDESQIEKKITKKTKAIIPVHWAGKICNMSKISKIAKKYNLKIVEDACHAYLSKLDNKFAGNFGHTGCFSLHPLKNVNVWGDGGVIVTNNKKIYLKLLLLRNHGLKNRNFVDRFGYVSRMDTIQAAILNYRIKNLNKVIKKRRENFKTYSKHLNTKYIFFPNEENYQFNTYHTFVIQVDKRDKLREYLNKNGVGTAIHYPIPIHLQKAAKHLNYKKGDFVNTETQAKRILTLPINESLNSKHIIKISNLVNKFYK